MKSVNERLKLIRNVLNNKLSNVDIYHYRRPGKGLKKYVIWQEDGPGTDMWADNHMREQQLHGTIDLYTLEEYDPLVDEVQEAMNIIMVGWSLQAVDYEDETNLIHYEWEWYL